MKYDFIEEGEYDEDGSRWRFYYLNDWIDLGEFISKEKPRIDLNKIPIKKWFVYYRDETGDNILDSICLLDDYIKEQTSEMMKMVTRINKLQNILKS